MLLTEREKAKTRISLDRNLSGFVGIVMKDQFRFLKSSVVLVVG